MDAPILLIVELSLVFGEGQVRWTQQVGWRGAESM